MSRTVYEIIDSIDNETVIYTENLEEAEEFYEKGYLVFEHCTDKIPITRRTYITITVTNKWGVKH